MTTPPLRILHVEDNPSDAELLRFQLNQDFEQLSINQVQSKEEFLESLKSNGHDLVLSDFKIPQFGGLEALQAVKEFDNSMPFILVSGTIGEDRAVEMLKKGATDYVLKENLQKLKPSILRAVNERNTIREKKLQFQQLQESEERYRSLFNSLPHGTFIYDLERQEFVDVNFQMLEMLGCDKDSFLGKSLDLLVPNVLMDNSRNKYGIDYMLYGRDQSKVESFETEFMTKSGDHVHVSARITRSMLRNGREVLICNARDISEEIRSEMSAQTANEVARLVNHGSMSLYDFGNFIHQKISKLLVFDGFAIVEKKSSYTITFPFVTDTEEPSMTDYLFRVGEKVMEDLFSEKRINVLTNYDLTKLGYFDEHEKNKSVKLYSAPIENEGKVVGTLLCWFYDNTTHISNNDITLLQTLGIQIGNFIHHMQTETHKKLLAAVVDNTSMAVYNIVNGKINSWNKGAEKMLGYTRDEILGLDPLELIPKGERRSILKKYEQMYKNPDRQLQIRTLQRAKSGKEITVEANLFPLFIDGKIKGHASILQDITDKVKAENALEELNISLEERVTERTNELSQIQKDLAISLEREKELGKLKTQFVSTASHQFRTPLTIIQSSLAILTMQLDDASKETANRVQNVFNTVQTQVQKMTDMMNEVLILGKIEGGGISAKPEKLNLVSFVRELSQKMAVANDHRICEVIVIGKERPVYLDHHLLEHALNNVISNALKYSKQQKEPTITINYTEQDEYTISVRDFGMGIPEGDMSKIFHPFYRASNTHEIAGTGLGMSIFKDYIELNGGDVCIESEEGKGTNVEIIFNDV
ncbi:MAG: hypothetical protein Salg2KO_10900 [Salibacteraceae bacterium]